MKPRMFDFLEEENTIGGVLLTPATELPPVVRELQPEHFSGPGLAEIWMAVQEQLGAGVQAEEVGICSVLRKWGHMGLEARVCELAANVPTAVNLAHWAQTVLDAGRHREARRLFGEAVDQAKISKSVEEIENLAINIVKIVGKKQKGENAGLRPVADILPEVLAEIESRKINPNAFRVCRTGLRDLDEMAELGAGQLTILAGRPGMGKSALGGNIALFVSETKPVAMFSLEMSRTSLVRRMLRVSMVDQSKLLIDDRGGLTVSQIRAEVSHVRGIALVVVDYLQLIRPDQKLERHDLRVGAVAKELRAMAKDFGCHVIALAQLNRQVESRAKNRPALSDLRDSGNLEEDADHVWLIYREGYYDNQAGNQTEIIVAKNRHGETGTVFVRWDGLRQQFTDNDQ